jgi:hypothetical protein
MSKKLSVIFTGNRNHLFLNNGEPDRQVKCGFINRSCSPDCAFCEEFDGRIKCARGDYVIGYVTEGEPE